MQAQEVLKRSGYETDETQTGIHPWPDMAQTAPSLFKVGDVVKLKSGGPDMTVVNAQPDVLRVSYYTEQQGFTRDSFPPDALVHTTDSVPAPSAD